MESDFSSVSKKQHTQKKNTQKNKQMGLQRCASRDRNKALCLSRQIKDTQGIYKYKNTTKKKSYILLTSVIFFTETDWMKPEKGKDLQGHRKTVLIGLNPRPVAVLSTIAAFKWVYCYFFFHQHCMLVQTPEQNLKSHMPKSKNCICSLSNKNYSKQHNNFFPPQSIRKRQKYNFE